MGLSRDDFKTRLKLRLGDRQDVDTLFQEWGDEGLIDLTTRRLEIRSLQQTATNIIVQPNVGSFPIPSSYFAIRFLEDITNKRVYRRFDGGMFEFLQARQSSSVAAPAQFIEDGPVVYLNPTPSVLTTITPYIYARATWATDPTNEPSIEPEWHHGVLLLGAYKAFQDLGDDDRALATKTEFEMWLAERDSAVRRTARTTLQQRGPQAEVGRRNQYGV